jgi:predicted Ser/Thr protein kinase
VNITAVKKRELQNIELLLDKGVDVNIEGDGEKRGFALRRGIIDNDLKLVTLLLENDAHTSIQGKDRIPNFPIRQAALNGEIKMVDVLLTHGADIRAGDGYGNADYPIKVAIKNQDKKMILFLLDNYDYDDDNAFKDMEKIGKLIFDRDIFSTTELKNILQDSSNNNQEMFKFIFDLIYHPKLEHNAIESVKGKYDIGKILGKGSFGTVYKGENKITGQRVAIKIQRSSVDDLLKELDILERISKDCHEYFLCVYEAIREVGGDIQIVVMEFVDGVDLTSIKKDKKDFTTEEINTIMDKLEISIQKLHDLGVAHKDIKPDNIMVTNDGKVKLVDYGLSCMDTKCKWGGTPRYMHPYIRELRKKATRYQWEQNDWFSFYTIGESFGMSKVYLQRIEKKFIDLKENLDNDEKLFWTK